MLKYLFNFIHALCRDEIGLFSYISVSCLWDVETPKPVEFLFLKILQCKDTSTSMNEIAY